MEGVEADNFYSIKHSSPAGDLLALLPGLRQMWQETGKTWVIMQRIGMIGVNQVGAPNAFQNDEGIDICFSAIMFDMIRPLLIAQEYIKDFIVFDGQRFDIDADRVRIETFTNQPFGEIRKYITYLVPQMSTDLSIKSLNVPDIGNSGSIIINFTERYRSRFIHYNFLREHQSVCIFAGLKKERDDFCNEWKLDIPLLKISDFLELASHIQACKFFIGCQSMCFQIAEQLKVPRILETYNLMPNVIPVGKHAYDFYSQSQLEFYFNKLMKL